MQKGAILEVGWPHATYHFKFRNYGNLNRCCQCTVGLKKKETIAEDQRFWRKSSFMGGRGEIGEKPKEANLSLVKGHNLQWMSKQNLYPSFSLLDMATAV